MRPHIFFGRVAKRGNDEADRLAKEGAKLHQVSTEDTERISLYDNAAYQIQTRLLKIARWRSNKNPRRNILYDNTLGKHRENMLDVLNTLGHHVTTRGQRQYCAHCQQTWTLGNRRAIIEMGPCRGCDIWGTISYDVERPQLLGIRSAPVYGNQPIHPSRSLAFLKGYLYCRLCGVHTSSLRVQGLATACNLIPANAAAERRRNRMQQGLHPYASTHMWPRGAPALPHDLRDYIVL